MNSNRKGKVYEREIARFLRGLGYDARRGQQHKGGADSPDVLGLPGFHIECKRTERLQLYEALRQSERDCGLDEKPIVIHRRNGERSVVIMYLDEFMDILEGRIGAWEETDDRWHIGRYRCTKCGDYNNWRSRYCPNCGIKMYEKEAHENGSEA